MVRMKMLLESSSIKRNEISYRYLKDAAYLTYCKSSFLSNVGVLLIAFGNVHELLAELVLVVVAAAITHIRYGWHNC